MIFLIDHNLKGHALVFFGAIALEVLHNHLSPELKLLGKSFKWLRQSVSPTYDFSDRS